ncbi:MAG TPA: hypoxanthine phosphoribosyltransferase [Bacteroidales bacterium]|nr:hypoxanthine phosphoribosyltransferase [Bacteroidales bacterium]
MKKIKILDKEFRLAMANLHIKRAVENIATQINNDYKDQDVLFISILNGSFMFTAELMKKIDLKCRISFIKVKSYAGDSSTGQVIDVIGLSEKVEGQHVILLEDIVDTGTTLSHLHAELKKQKPASLKIASLLFKPLSYQKNLKIDYVGIEMANEFLVGFGLDYDGYGRNFEDIYKAC